MAAGPVANQAGTIQAERKRRSRFWPASSLFLLGGSNALEELRRLLFFALASLAVFYRDFHKAQRVVRPLAASYLYRTAVKLLPLVLLLSLALGLMVIGQTVIFMTRVGARDWLGSVMVAVIVRELGPILTALLVLARSGTSNVVDLGVARAQGEVESLEAVGVDPIHYLVLPRVVCLAIAVLALTVYLIFGAVLSGYLWAFWQNVPLLPGEYFRQLALAMRGLDFVLVLGKCLVFGTIIGLVTSYHGLSQPLRMEDVPGATVRAVGQSLMFALLAELFFLTLSLTL